MTKALRTDPLRNFKFQVEFASAPDDLGGGLSKLGFISMSGINVQTEMIAYREGGFNTSPHKMPGQTDFGPVTFTGGVFADRTGAWDWTKQMYAVQWGNGLLSQGDSFRTDVIIRVLDHPVTRGPAAGKESPAGAKLAFRLYNAWLQGLAWNDLNAGDNSLMIQQMTLVHEGVDVKYGDAASTNWAN
jgi:phage tail-like protein